MEYDLTVRTRQSRVFARGAVSVRVAVIVLILAIAASVWFITPRTKNERITLLTSVRLPASTSITTAPASKPVVAKSYLDVVHLHHPEYATTEPFSVPADRLADAARIVIDEPIYLDSAGELWITRPDAPTVVNVLRTLIEDAQKRAKHRSNILHRAVAATEETLPPIDTQTHVTRDRVVFTYTTVDANGNAERHVIVRRPDAAGGYELVSNDARIELGTAGRTYAWDRAVWVSVEKESYLVVPTADGIAIIRPQSRPMEIFQSLTDSSATTQPAHPQPQYLLDGNNLLAWLPWEYDQPGGHGAFRYLDGKWTTLDEKSGWAERIVQIVPLLDGSVLQLSIDPSTANTVLNSNTIDGAGSADIDEKRITELVTRLSDEEFDKREAAHAELSRYGPQVWSILEKLHDAQPAEGQVRIEQLLQARKTPMLGRVVLEPGKVKVAARFGDGGAILWAEAGVRVPSIDPSKPNSPIAPAWISILPGRPIELAPAALVNDVDPDHANMSGTSGEIIVTDDVHGPQRFLGNHLEPMLAKRDRAEFSRVIGFDQRGRWLFRKTSGDSPTLVLDPTLPDFTPRLPVWHYPVQQGTVGWTESGWPVVKSGSAWVIEREGTRPLKPNEKMFSSLAEMPAAARRLAIEGPDVAATRASTTRTSTTTTSSTRPAGEPIGFDSTGGKYFDGLQLLTRVASDGTITTWDLPASSSGTWTRPWLVEAENRLFLFNESGRVIRLRRDAASDVYTIEATFVRNIPNVEEAMRIWRDPAGRIIIAHEGNALTILFPSGRIPAAIAERMLAADLRANEDE